MGGASMSTAGLENCDDSAAPGRLWSLLDIMKRFNAAFFMGRMNIFGGSRVQGLWTSNFPPSRVVYNESDKAFWDKAYAATEANCIEMELIASYAQIIKIRHVLSQQDSSISDIIPLETELSERLIAEMAAKSFFYLSISEAEYFKNPLKKWEQIVARFQDIITDVEEASKCFSLSRYGASVFHSTQIVEVGLIELGTYIGVNDPRSGWTAVTNKLTAIIKKAHADRTDFEKRNFDFLEQIHGTTEALKNAWRNKIGHAQGRLILMSKDFSPEIAEEILFASRAFMRRLADGLPPLEIKSGF
jgi:hypothetical protein